MRRNRLIRLLILIAISLALYRFRWGILGLVGIGPPQRACEDIAALNAYLRTGGSPSAYLGRTPLIVCAAESGSYEVVSKLIELDIDIDAQRKALPLPIMFQDIGTTALYETVDEGHLELAKLLLDNGADINLKRATDSPLNLTLVQNKPEFLRLFLETDGISYEFDEGRISGTGYSGYLEVLEVLFEAGIHSDEAYERTLRGAIYRGHLEVVFFLLNEGVSVNQELAPKGRNALHLSIRRDHFNITKFLVDYGIEINAMDDEGNTPLHYAAIFNRPEAAELLLKTGANLQQENHKGETPLESAISNNSSGVEEILKGN